jgi:hypothetical protein
MKTFVGACYIDGNPVNKGARPSPEGGRKGTYLPYANEPGTSFERVYSQRVMHASFADNASEMA